MIVTGASILEELDLDSGDFIRAFVMHRCGWSDRKIAAYFGVNTNTVVWMIGRGFELCTGEGTIEKHFSTIFGRDACIHLDFELKCKLEWYFCTSLCFDCEYYRDSRVGLGICAAGSRCRWNWPACAGCFEYEPSGCRLSTDCLDGPLPWTWKMFPVSLEKEGK